MPILFQNDGELDPRLMTTLGTNVKESANPIGYFGTGLKYAISTLLRCEQEIIVYSGEDKYEFQVQPVEIRGKLFGIIQYAKNGGDWIEMNITTEVGKNWELWMAFRELYTNALDEGGYALDDEPVPIPGTTVVTVNGERFRDVYETRWSYFINPARRPIYRDNNVEIYEGSNNRVFCKGVAVHKPHKALTFTYNVLANCALTEDRTASEFELFFWVHRAIKELKDEKITRRYLSIPEGYLEHEMSWYGGETNKEFGKVFRSVWAANPAVCNQNIRERVERDSRMEDSELTDATLTENEEGRIADAIKFAQFAGLEIPRDKVRVVNEIEGAPRTIRDKLVFNKKHINAENFDSSFIAGAAMICAGMHDERHYLAMRLRELAERLWKYEN